jgi:hypothetical protein
MVDKMQPAGRQLQGAAPRRRAQRQPARRHARPAGPGQGQERVRYRLQPRQVGNDFYANNAAMVHGCDIYDLGITVARETFADRRDVEARFEVVDLTRGPSALGVFNMPGYDFVLCLATYHKLKRLMKPDELTALMQFFGRWTRKYFAWRGTSDKPAENEQEIEALDRDLGATGLRRLHTSYLSSDLGVACIWPVHDTAMLQDEREIDALAELFAANGVKSYLEIGSKFGGSLQKIADRMPAGSRIVAVDMPKRHQGVAAIERRASRCRARSFAARLPRPGGVGRQPGSKDGRDRAWARPVRCCAARCRSPPAGVTLDWQNYGPMGRMVAFHDIAWRRAPEWIGTRIDVPQLWEQLKADHRHVEFRFDPSGKNNGIGVLWR